MAIARVKEELSSPERQAGQCWDKGANNACWSMPSRYLLLKDLSDDLARHLVQTRIGAIGDDARDGGMLRQQQRNRSPHRKSVNIDLAAGGFRLAGRDIHGGNQIVDLRIAARGRNERTLTMPAVIEQQDVGPVGIFEGGDRAEVQTGYMKPVADDDRRGTVRLGPELAA